MSLTDDYTDHRRRGVYVDGPMPGPAPAPLRPSGREFNVRIGWLSRPLRGTGVRLLRLAERLEA